MPEVDRSVWPGVVIMMVDAFTRPSQRWITGSLSLLGLAAAGLQRDFTLALPPQVGARLLTA